MPNTRKLVAILDEQERLIGVMDPSRTSAGVDYDVRPRAGQKLYEVEVPATLGSVPPHTLREAVATALSLPGARTPYLGRRKQRDGRENGSGKPE